MAIEIAQNLFSPRFCKWPWFWLRYKMDIISGHSNSYMEVYVIAHTKEKPCTTNWNLSQNSLGNYKSQKSEQNLPENVYY